MSRIPRHLNLESEKRPCWRTADARSELTYLGWGLRDYARYPSFQHINREIWSYTLILRGTPTIQLADGIHRLSPREAILFSAHGRYSLGLRDTPGSLSEVLIWTWKTPPSIPRIRPPLGGYFLRRMEAEACRRMEAAHADCRREVAFPDAYTSNFLKAIRKVIDTEFARALSGAGSKSDDEVRAELAVRWLKRNLQRENLIFLLCNYLQLSHSTVVRLFQNVFRQSPTAYHRRMRMEEAQRLLDGGKFSVKEVAYRLGYKHPTDFSRAFRKFRTGRRKDDPDR